jgi:hypothetical protein
MTQVRSPRSRAHRELPPGRDVAEKAAAFSAVIGAVRTTAPSGTLSIVEGMPFSRRGEYEAVAAATASHGRSAMAILLKVDPAVAAERIANQPSAGRFEPQPAMAADRDTTLPFTVHARFREPPPSTLELDARADRLELLNAAAELSYPGQFATA